MPAPLLPPALPALDRRRIASFRRRLCGWFAAHRRDLPWRGVRDPYAIWVSEAMLQQTRVDVVLPYYARFLARFPRLEDLARAGEDEVLALWSGLGYYRRARGLHAGARAVVAEHGGRLPRSREALLALPGIGPYTAGALLSIAFDLPEPLVDGNVARVLARHFWLAGALDAGPGRARLWQLARALVPPSPARAANIVAPRWFNQALMELGALVCTPRAPRCERCPLRASCAARARGRTEELPHGAAPRASLAVRLEILVVRRGARTLLVRRPSGGRMERLWELPTRELPAPAGTSGLWPAEHALPLTAGDELGLLRHAITHHRVAATVRAGRLGRGAHARRAELCWVAADEAGDLALTGLSRKALDLAAGRAVHGAGRAKAPGRVRAPEAHGPHGRRRPAARTPGG